MLYADPFLTVYCCLLAALLGACMGSFLNCAAWRIVHGESVLRGRSHCDACGHVLAVRDLIPVVSYLAAHGRCRYCGAKLSRRHVLAEAVSALVFVTLLLHYDISLQALEGWCVAGILLACSFADLEGYIIPDRFIAVGVVLFITTLFFDPQPLQRALDGAIGGLAVGEPAEVMYEMIDVVEPFAPADKPRYLMGVGTPSNIIEAVARGVDFFDCVMPSRNGRHGKLFTWEGTVNIMNEKYITDDRPISESCNCPVCRSHSRAYLRHLFKADEVLALRLAVLHNLWFYNELMAKIREALDNGTFADFREKYSGNLEKRA
mgnify:CR=1 FL=1